MHFVLQSTAGWTYAEADDSDNEVDGADNDTRDGGTLQTIPEVPHNEEKGGVFHSRAINCKPLLVLDAL